MPFKSTKPYRSKVKLDVLITKDHYGIHAFHATKEKTVAPKIIREFDDEEGVAMYECEGGRLFIAEVYDKNFKPVHHVKLALYKTHGANANYRVKR